MKYRCTRPLTLKQLYLPAGITDKVTIQPGRIWCLISNNKNSVTLEEKTTELSKMRCRITFECLNEYFDEIAE